ncbi:hypothetical protein IT072_17425 [Leifsonia sp. ZF2019]|uniref:hypothetical protein n=1 Tax=Leifsonia sp. ZF2019 TaxID=2781978 RepID=UPI001CC0CD74|nr:hypothetical protein [Leifsonia sp. ZF2019]UAJ78973.1 hypothetical protein IT072_17425 [Leifsonia sp. ZF2019]
MTLRSIWAIVVRWKWVLLPGLVVALGVGGFLFMKTPRTYTVESSYLFLSPVKDVKGVAGNPLLTLGNGVPLSVDVVAVSLMDGDTVRTFSEHHPDLKYTVSRDTSLAAPLMTISVEDSDLAYARSTLDALGKLVPSRLDALQQKAGAPQEQWVTTTNLTTDRKPTISYSTPIRNGLIGFAGVMLVVGIAVAIAERIRAGHAQRAAAPVRKRTDAIKALPVQEELLSTAKRAAGGKAARPALTSHNSGLGG